jgi:hypothetical protein
MDSVNLNCPCRCGRVSTGRRDPVHLHKLMKISKTDLLRIGGNNKKINKKDMQLKNNKNLNIIIV